MDDQTPPDQGGGITGDPHFRDDPAAAEVRAWEEVDAGRYMPRRIKGSCKGRALGWAFAIPSGSDGQISR